MDFIVSASTDTGLIKSTNQDSYNVRVFDTKQGKIVLAVLCDGMGGLDKGEVASASLVNAFCRWADERLATICKEKIRDEDIRRDWTKIVNDYNEKIKIYASSFKTNMGTTVTAILISEERYYIINIGDTRVYELNDELRIITKDQTMVAREVELGNMTWEEARKDPRRSVLLQCVGASEVLEPDMFFGDTKLNAVYMLCTDGFRHEITNDEIFKYLGPEVLTNSAIMKQNMDYLVNLNLERQERDNISVITIRTF